MLDDKDFHQTIDDVEVAYKKAYDLLSKAAGRDIWSEQRRYLCELEYIAKYVPRGGKILDVGCGTGQKIIAMQLMGRQAYGVDSYISGDIVMVVRAINKTAMIKDLMEEWKTDIRDVWETNGVHFNDCDISQYPTPYDDESFDCVSCCAVLEHLHTSPRFILGEMKRVLKKNGVIIITVPNLGSISKRINFFLGRRHYLPLDYYFFESDIICRGHVREFYPHEVTKMIKWIGGLEIIHLSLLDFSAHAKNTKNPIKFLYSKFMDLLKLIYPNFRSDIIVVSRKVEL